MLRLIKSPFVAFQVFRYLQAHTNFIYMHLQRSSFESQSHVRHEDKFNQKILSYLCKSTENVQKSW